jgi:hypothetical protein
MEEFLKADKFKLPWQSVSSETIREKTTDDHAIDAFKLIDTANLN